MLLFLSAQSGVLWIPWIEYYPRLLKSGNPVGTPLKSAIKTNLIIRPHQITLNSINQKRHDEFMKYIIIIVYCFIFF